MTRLYPYADTMLVEERYAFLLHGITLGTGFFRLSAFHFCNLAEFVGMPVSV